MFGEDGLLHELLVERFNYCIYVVLLLIGLYAMIAKNNLIKKVIGMSIFQTAIILFYVSVGVKEGATIPIYKPEHDPHGHHAASEDTNTSGSDEANGTTASAAAGKDEHRHGPVALTDEETRQYANPIPHVLMLTAIVVGVATLGVALALVQRIYRAYGTIEEDEVMQRLLEELDEAKASSGGLKAKPKRGKANRKKGRKPSE
ncbi:MAG: cation:proton antiporter subunit C [Opitutales bacterium]